jgi:hypothetical protein
MIGATTMVESFNALNAAHEAAMLRIKEMQSQISLTLVDIIPTEMWATWDASAEIAIVTDPGTKLSR